MDTYEKKYKEAQKWIESIYSELSHEQQMEAEAFFPELKESEDERISKEIIKYLERTVPHHHRDEVLKSKEWTAWLEKQGEQKPTLRERYKNIAESEWFKKTHDGMSVSNDEGMIEALRTEYEKGRADVIADTISWLENCWPQYCSNQTIIEGFKEAIK